MQSDKATTDVAQPTDPLVGTVLGDHLRILSRIGTGGMSIVYKAEDLLLHRHVAVKILHSHTALNPKNLMRFRQEAMAASKIDHPNVIRVYEFNIPDHGQPYLVMDFIEGLSLADFIAVNGPIEMRRAISLMTIICQGLQCAHDAGVVHRDLKPGNIMLLKDSSGRQTLKIVDFGIAKVLTEDTVGHDLTQTGEVFGSPLYMSPEQCFGKPLDSRSDIYSLGCVMYEMCTGHPPIKGTNLLETIQLQTTEMPAPSTTKYQGIKYGAQFDRIIARALAKNPLERYQSASEFAAALNGISDELASTEKSPLPGAKQMIAAAVTVALLVCAGIFVYSFVSKPLPFEQPSIFRATETDGDDLVSVATARRLTDQSLRELYNNAPKPLPDKLLLNESDITSRGLQILANRPEIKTIRVGNSRITDAAGTIIAQIPNLVKLDSQGNFEKSSILTNKFCQDISQLKHLRIVNLQNSNITDEAMDHLVKLPLTALGVSETNISDAGLAKLKHLSLRQLRISKTKVTGDGLKYIEHMQPTMTKLISERNHKIGDIGAAHIAKLTNLTVLELSQTWLTDAGIKELTALKKLTVLKANYNRLSDLSMQYLTELPNLKMLDVRGNKINQDALAKFQERNPACVVNESK